MSRICVKNLPKYVAEERLREFFSQKGEITDVKLMRTRDGKSRQFGFIGFRTEDEANEAIKYFNRSYLDTCRITCEVARKVGDPNIPRPWSRYSLKKEEKVTQDGKKNAENRSVVEAKGGGENLKESTDIDDPQLQEFLQVMQPRAKSKLWANDSLAVLDDVNEKEGIAENISKDISVPVHDESVQRGSSEGGSSDNDESEKLNDLVHDDVISDMEYFKSRVTKKWSDSGSSDDDEDNNNASVSSDDDDKDNDSHGNEGEENCDNKSSKGTGRSGAQNLDPLGQEDIHGEDDDHGKANVSNHSGDKVPEHGVLASCLEDEKGVSESCRLFVRNLPYTATYIL